MPPHDQIDTAERLVRLETKLDFLINSLNDLPPSPECVNKHEKIEERLTNIETWHNRTIGALVALNLLLTIFSEKIRGLFS